jgi:type I restriction enzyme S subunit
MASSWPTAPLRDHADLVMGQSPPGDTYNYEGVGLPLLNGPTEFGLRHPSATLFTTAAAKRSQPGDLLLCVRGSTTGRTNWADREYCLGRGVAALRARSGSPADTRFLYYALVQNLRLLLSRTSGSVFPNLSKADLESFELPWPSRSDREHVAHVLGGLDDLVLAERSLATSSHNLAAELFRHELLAQEAALGRRPLGELVEIHKLPTQPSATPAALFEHHSIPAFDAGERPVRELGEEMLSGKTGIPTDGSVVLFSKLNPGTLRAWWPLPTGTVPAVASPEFVALRARNGVPLAFVYASIRHDGRFLADVLGRTGGTTGSRQRVRPADVLASGVVAAEPADVDAWAATATPLYARARKAIARTAHIEGIRDALLPRLMSGKLSAVSAV